MIVGDRYELGVGIAAAVGVVVPMVGVGRTTGVSAMGVGDIAAGGVASCPESAPTSLFR